MTVPFTKKIPISLALVSLILTGCNFQKFREIGEAPEMSQIGSGMRYSNAPQILTQPRQPPKRVNTFSLWSDHKSSLFQDTRAMSIGDILTVDISIDDSASFANQSERKRSNSGGLNGSGSFSTLLGKITAGPGNLSHSSNTTTTGDGSTERSEKLTIRMAAVVTGVMDNGNLIISGSQEIRVNYELRVLNVAGIVRPKDIDSKNVVAYEKIAEARISYGGKGRLTEVQRPPIGQQVIDAVTPF